jgi:hypothetical protein
MSGIYAPSQNKEVHMQLLVVQSLAAEQQIKAQGHVQQSKKPPSGLKRHQGEILISFLRVESLPYRRGKRTHPKVIDLFSAQHRI